MTRQLTIFLTLAVSVLIAVLLYFTLFSGDVKKFALQHAIPDNAVLIAEFKSPEENIERILNSEWFSILNNQEDVQQFSTDLLFLDSLILKNSNFNNTISGGEMAISLHPYANKTLSYFACVRLKNDISQSDLLDFFNTNYSGRFGYNKRVFANETIYEFTDFVLKRKLSIAFKEGLLLASFDGMLCELAILKLKRKLFYGSTTKADFIYHNSYGVNLYINPQHITKYLNLYSKTNVVNLPFIDKFCNQLALNTEIESDAIQFKGLSITHDTLFQFLDLINGQSPTESVLTSLLPDNFSYAYLLHLSNYQTYQANVIEYLNARGKFQQYQSYNDSVEQHLQINISENLTRFFSTYAGVFSVVEPGISYDSSVVAAIGITDQDALRKLLLTYSISANKRQETDTLNTENQSSEVGYCNLGTIMKLYWGDAFESVPFQYYAIINNTLLFGSNQNSISHCLAKIQQKQVVSENKTLSKNLRLLPEKSNMQLLVNGSLAYKHLLNQVNGQTHSYLVKQAIHFNRLNFAGFIFAGSIDKSFITQGTILFNTDKAKDAELSLSVELDTTIIAQPTMLYNSLKQDYIMLVQDAAHNLHFIDGSGVTFKTTKLFDPIISEIKEVDLFNNNKTYYVCNSEKFVYVFNETGDAAYGWPVWIPTGTKFPLTIGKINNDFVIFVTGNLYKIAGFNNAGQLINGFNPKNIWPNAISSVGEFVYGNVPYVYVLNQQGKIASFTEQGIETNVLAVDSSIMFKQVVMQQVDTGMLNLFGIDSAYFYQLRCQSIATKSVLVKKLPLQDMANVKSVNNGQFLLHNHHGFKLLGKDLNPLATYNTIDSLIHFTTTTLAGKPAVVYFNASKQEVNALDYKNKTLSPFPVTSTALFSINQAIDGNYLLVADKNTLNIYRLRP